MEVLKVINNALFRVFRNKKMATSKNPFASQRQIKLIYEELKINNSESTYVWVEKVNNQPYKFKKNIIKAQKKSKSSNRRISPD